MSKAFFGPGRNSFRLLLVCIGYINQFLNRSIKLHREGENTPVTNWFAPIPARP